MFDPFTLALIGGAAGGLLNKRDPLKGALLGAGAGAAGGYFAPSLMGGAAAAPAGQGGLLAFNAAKDSQLANAALGSEALAGYGGAASPAIAVNGQPELFGQLKDAATAAKPFGDAAGAAVQVNGLLGAKPQGVQASQMQQPMVSGNQVLAQIAQQGQQQMQMEEQAAAKRKQRRQGLLGASYG